jgi:hypothetical protein
MMEVLKNLFQSHKLRLITLELEKILHDAQFFVSIEIKDML